jgi:hypothetical protein
VAALAHQFTWLKCTFHGFSPLLQSGFIALNRPAAVYSIRAYTNKPLICQTLKPPFREFHLVLWRKAPHYDFFVARTDD